MKKIPQQCLDCGFHSSTPAPTHCHSLNNDNNLFKTDISVIIHRIISIHCEKQLENVMDSNFQTCLNLKPNRGLGKTTFYSSLLNLYLNSGQYRLDRKSSIVACTTEAQEQEPNGPLFTTGAHSWSQMDPNRKLVNKQLTLDTLFISLAISQTTTPLTGDEEQAIPPSGPIFITDWISKRCHSIFGYPPFISWGWGLG
ncbi:hypothetical protein FRC20_006101 [Serendipita sp. 405]|nr:hypothetical protein FRC20_006101 [Serendipita sp. 405]